MICVILPILYPNQATLAAQINPITDRLRLSIPRIQIRREHIFDVVGGGRTRPKAVALCGSSTLGDYGGHL